MSERRQRRIDVYITPSQVEELFLSGKNVVIVDVLRASTTVTAALSNGAKEIIPVATIENAVKVSGSLFGDVTLRGGERNGKIIEGFNLGNSPSEYTGEIVRGKSIIYTTTNGSVAMARARYARNAVVGGFVNVARVIAFLKELKEDFIILCAGHQNDFSLEDVVCAGMILSRLQKGRGTFVLDDAGKAALTLIQKFGKNILAMLQESEHGKFLAESGFAADLKLCAAVDSLPVLPVMSGNVVKLIKDVTTQGAAA